MLKSPWLPDIFWKLGPRIKIIGFSDQLKAHTALTCHSDHFKHTVGAHRAITLVLQAVKLRVSNFDFREALLFFGFR